MPSSRSARPDPCSPATRNAIAASFVPGVGRAALLGESRRLANARDEKDAVEIVSSAARSRTQGAWVSPESVDRALAMAEKFRIRIYSTLDPEFPACLRGAKDSPFFLTVRAQDPRLVLAGGLLDAWRGLAVIGMREATGAGLYATEWLVRSISEESDTHVTPIVSGLALGIDVEAHRAAIRHFLPTVAVMAGGLEKVSPKENAPDADEIVDKGGALVSEYLPGAKVSRGAFVERDRIQAMYSRAVVAMQCGDRSGTFYAVAAAARTGRSIFAFRHGDPKASVGTDALIAGRASDNSGEPIRAAAKAVSYAGGVEEILAALGRPPEGGAQTIFPRDH